MLQVLPNAQRGERVNREIGIWPGAQVPGPISPHPLLPQRMIGGLPSSGHPQTTRGGNCDVCQSGR